MGTLGPVVKSGEAQAALRSKMGYMLTEMTRSRFLVRFLSLPGPRYRS